MDRLRLTLLLLLILGPHSAILKDEEEDDLSEEVSKEAQDAAEEILTKAICIDALHQQPQSPLKELCCKTHFAIGNEEAECLQTHPMNTNDNLIAVHDLANCIYVKKKFTRGNENLNFNRIRAYLSKIDDPRERKFMMKVYKECNDYSKRSLKAIKAKTKPGNLPLGMRRPFYTLVFICTSTYSEQKSCPYMLWEKNTCGKFISECRQLLQEETF